MENKNVTMKREYLFNSIWGSDSYRVILIPFNSMSTLTVELAKGNLSTQIKEEKSKFFGKFLWGMDMLRENLEESKATELELQKEKKTFCFESRI